MWRFSPFKQQKQPAVSLISCCVTEFFQIPSIILFSGFLGIFGIDRFYAKNITIGIIKLVLGLPIVVTIFRTLFNLIFYGFSNFLESFLMNFPYAFALNQSKSIFPTIILAVIPYLPITIFSIRDFVLCVLGKIRDSEHKLIIKW